MDERMMVGKSDVLCDGSKGERRKVRQKGKGKSKGARCVILGRVRRKEGERKGKGKKKEGRKG